MMSRTCRALFSLISPAAALAALTLAGCGSASVAVRPTTVSQRQEMVVGREAPQLLAVGPARLLHVDLAGSGNASLYLVDVKPGTRAEAACRSGHPIGLVALRGAGTHRMDLDVDSDQAVCVAADTNANRAVTEMAWHAEPAAPALGPGTLHASAP